MSVLSRLAVAAAQFADPLVKNAFRFLVLNTTVAAAGSDNTDATALTSGQNLVTGADGTVGVILPVAEQDMSVTVVNTVASQSLKIYPNSSDQINALTATTGAFTLYGGSEATFRCDVGHATGVAGHWYVRAASNAAGTATTASTAELNLLDGSVAGTSVASKALALGADKNTDVLALPVSGLRIGAGAGTAVDTTAAELNVLNGVTPGTSAAAAKALVTDANGAVDVLRTASLRVGTSGAETTVTATGTEINTLAAANAKLATEAAAGITGGTGTIYKSSVQALGGVIKTTILIDLTGLSSSTTDLDIIGQGASAAHIGRITAARNGTILGGSMKCLEAPAGGINDIDFYSANEATGKFDDAIGDLTETAIVTSGGAWSAGTEKYFNDVPVANEYLYLTGGAGGTAAAYTAGQFLITLYGY